MKQEIEDEINEAFHLFDTNRKNFLNRKELKVTLPPNPNPPRQQ
jgi:Ca2+-binding EF-hand superfamily protein